MQTLHFSISINAPKDKVFKTMLDDTTYREWTGAFMPGSYFVGSWEKGSKIQFLAPDEDGKKSGMTSQIIENRPNEFVSIKHLGTVMGDVEDTTSEEAKKWVGFENYTFKDQDGKTEISVSLDVNDAEFANIMNGMWPKALLKLKEISEQSPR